MQQLWNTWQDLLSASFIRLITFALSMAYMAYMAWNHLLEGVRKATTLSFCVQQKEGVLSTHLLCFLTLPGVLFLNWCEYVVSVSLTLVGLASKWTTKLPWGTRRVPFLCKGMRRFPKLSQGCLGLCQRSGATTIMSTSMLPIVAAAALPVIILAVAGTAQPSVVSCREVCMLGYRVTFLSSAACPDYQD